MSGDIRFDRTRFNAPLRGLLSSPDDEVRAAALQALPSFEVGQDDLQLVAPLAEDRSPRVRVHVASALAAANARVGSAELDAAMLRLLDDPDMNVRRESMRAINNIDVSEQVEAKMLALSRDPKIGRDAITLGLTSRPLVRGEVATRLIELLDDPDQGTIVNRATFALRNATIEGDARAALDAALLRTLEDSLNAGVRDNCITALARSPDPVIWARLAQLAEDPNETERIREAAARVLR
jgi:HEAT repeat protein